MWRRWCGLACVVASGYLPDPYREDCDALSDDCRTYAYAACERDDRCGDDDCTEEHQYLWCHVILESEQDGEYEGSVTCQDLTVHTLDEECD